MVSTDVTAARTLRLGFRERLAEVLQELVMALHSEHVPDAQDNRDGPVKNAEHGKCGEAAVIGKALRLR